MIQDQRQAALQYIQVSSNSGVQDSFTDEMVRKLQTRAAQGEGRPIVSALTPDGKFRFVIVGREYRTIPGAMTFHDFVGSYLRECLGSDWGNAEIKKPYEQRHPIPQWYEHLSQQHQRLITSPGTPTLIPATGPGLAYMSLAYDLLTLMHNDLLREKLVSRIKHRDQFQGARYETFVAAAFVRAGFDVQLEDEGDPRTSHCEFLATHRNSGSKFSVEAKSRHRPGLLGRPGTPTSWDVLRADVAGLIKKALRKNSTPGSVRIVFVDVNMPPTEGPPLHAEWLGQLKGEIDHTLDAEASGEPWPQAILVFTNHPYHYVGPSAPVPGLQMAMFPFKFKTVGHPAKYVYSRNPAVKTLLESILHRMNVPDSFE